MDATNPSEDSKAKFRVGHHLRHGAGGEPRLEAVGEPRLEAVQKMPRKSRFAVVIVKPSAVATT